MKTLLLALVLLSSREPIDPWPPVEKPETGCVLIVTTQGSIVVCK